MRHRNRFCRVKGDTAVARMLERVYDGLDGGVRDRPWETCENVWQHYSPGKRMFECGPSWGLDYDVRTDSPGLFVGLTGWLPFLEPFLRVAYRRTLQNICAKQRADGCFPIYPQHAQYKTEEGVFAEWGLHKYHVDDYVDGHLCAVISTCEDILFTRDAKYGRSRLPRLRKAVRYVLGRRFADGLMEVGYGGAFVELWYAFEGYPATTQIFMLRALYLLAEVERFLGHNGEAEQWLDSARPTRKALKRLLTPKGFFLNAIDTNGKRHGTGRDYYEAIPNVVAAALEIVGEEQARKIVASIKGVPQLDAHCPIAVNYPGRTEPMHPLVGKRGVGAHWNGGAWMGFGGFEVWTHLVARDYAKAERLINQMLAIRNEFGLQDFVAGFGAHLGANVFRREPCDHPIISQQGACGNALRGLLGVQPRHDGLKLVPRLFPSVETIDLRRPIYYGDSEIYVSIRNGDCISEVLLDGRPIDTFTAEAAMLKSTAMRPGRRRVEIRC